MKQFGKLLFKAPFVSAGNVRSFQHFGKLGNNPEAAAPANNKTQTMSVRLHMLHVCLTLHCSCSDWGAFWQNADVERMSLKFCRCCLQILNPRIKRLGVCCIPSMPGGLAAQTSVGQAL